ncbi:MAG: glycosyltransferase [Lachnospiraceae bacterium]|nr:glycosyltransferase [Lachnospiraceae bacterium]
MDLVSVIVPVYNIELYVGQCIESIIKQTYKNIEIILVDDGSLDKSGFICDLYSRKDDRVRVIHKKNGGLVLARKSGLKASKGDYIANIDGDDWIEKDYIETMMKRAALTGADVVIAGFSRDFMGRVKRIKNSIAAGSYEGEKLLELKKNMMSYREFYRPGITTYLWNKVFKRGLIERYKMAVDENITIGEDAAVTFPALESASFVDIIDNYSYHYRQRDDSMLKGFCVGNSELEKIKLLGAYLKTALKEDQIKKQAEDFILANSIMRTGGAESEEFLPFGVSFKGRKVVIVLAGTFGQMIREQARSSGEYQITGWVDDDYWEYRRFGMDVDSFENICQMEFDYAIIAKIEPEEIKKIKKRLMDLGVSREKILSVLGRRKVNKQSPKACQM